jgi:predicted hotdog family 3-hydroxylacyl-ACP dehydratase
MKDWHGIEPRHFLPHREPMILIDRIALVHTDYVESEVTIQSGTPFLRGGSVPAWVGVEYMAQTCAAFAGFEAHERGEPPRVGFLLAARNYRCQVGGFELGSALRVRVTLIHRDAGGLSMVEGKITNAESAVLVEATLTVYEVESLSKFLSESRGAR